MALALAPERNERQVGDPPRARLARSAWRAFATRLGARRTGLTGGSCSLVVLDVGELPELRQLFGDRAAHHTVAAIRRALQRIDPAVGRVSRTTDTSFAVLLPGYDEEAAAVAVRAALGDAGAIESDWHGEELVVVPDFLIRTSGDSPRSIDQLHRQLLKEIAVQRQRSRRHLDYLRRERESHLQTTKAVLLSAA